MPFGASFRPTLWSTYDIHAQYESLMLTSFSRVFKPGNCVAMGSRRDLTTVVVTRSEQTTHTRKRVVSHFAPSNVRLSGERSKTGHTYSIRRHLSVQMSLEAYGVISFQSRGAICPSEKVVWQKQFSTPDHTRVPKRIGTGMFQHDRRGPLFS